MAASSAGRSPLTRASTIIDTPMAQMTCRYTTFSGKSPVHAKLTTVISSASISSPRLSRKARTGRGVPPGGWAYSQALTPASNTNTGAQKCAARREKKTSGGVVATFIGSLTCRCR